MRQLFTSRSNGSNVNVIVGAALVALLFLAGSTAQAASSAIVAFSRVSMNSAGFGYGVHAQAGTSNSFATVTVGSTPGTPKVSWPAGVFTGQASGTYGPFTQYGYPGITSYRSAYWTVHSGMLQKSHAGAVAGTVNPITVPTTSCVDPGNCFASRGGTMMSSPSAKKYGGTALWFRHSDFAQFATSPGVGGYVNLSGSAQQSNLIPPFKSEVEKRGFAFKLHTSPAFPVPVYTSVQAIFGAAYTTGMITGMKTNPIVSTFMHTASNNLNPTNLTGTISVVVPQISFSNNTCRDFFDDVVAAQQTSGVPDGLCDYDGATVVAFNGINQDSQGYNEIKLTFLGDIVPEPGVSAMVGAGILALASAARLRRRS